MTRPAEIMQFQAGADTRRLRKKTWRPASGTPARDAGGHGHEPVYLEFRDGVTVVSADGLNFTDRQLDVDAMEHATRSALVRTRTSARVANATRDDYRRAGGTEAVGQDSADDKSNRWPAFVRANELRAQDTGKDELLRGLAMRLRSTLAQAG